MALELFMKDASRLGGMVLDAAYPIKRARRQGIAVLELELAGPVDPAVKNVPILVLVGEVDGGARSGKRSKRAGRRPACRWRLSPVPDKRAQWLFDAPHTERLERVAFPT